jgi:adenine/guanine phosphoribosyltransferase-like PRPP-binding protein
VDAGEADAHDVILTDNVGATPACVTEIVSKTILAPEPTVNVTVAVRGVILVCAVALSDTFPLPFPPDALTVNHGSSLVTVHAVFEVMLIIFVDTVEAGTHDVSLIANVGSAPVCVTEIVLVIAPTVTVTVAVRGVILVCAVALSVIFPFPVPLDALTVNQV